MRHSKNRNFCEMRKFPTFNFGKHQKTAHVVTTEKKLRWKLFLRVFEALLIENEIFPLKVVSQDILR